MLEAERIEDAVLVGHSYGGRVITGVADRVPGRVDVLVYIDAYVPGDGDAVWGLATDDLRRWFLEGARTDGYGVAPLPFLIPERRRTRSLRSSSRSGSLGP